MRDKLMCCVIITRTNRMCRRVALMMTGILVAGFCFCPHIGASGDESIFEAVRQGDENQVKKILSAKPKAVNATDENGSTPLHELSTIKTFGLGFQGQLSSAQAVSPIAKILVSKGGNLNARDKKGRTPLMCAIGRDEVSLATFLIEKGADVNRTIDTPNDLQGLSPLHAAVGHGHVDLAKLLMNKGAKLNVQVKDGNTPLHIAAIYNYPECAKALVEKGADVEVKNKKGQTPLEAALAAGNQTVVDVLQGRTNVQRK